MTTRKQLFGMALLLGLVWSSHGYGQEQSTNSESETTPASKTAYFSKSRNDVPEKFRLYVSLPTGLTPLPSDEYPQVIRTFAWWARKILKPEYVPSDAFMAANIRLFPATKDRKADTAFLAFRQNGADYLITQTGGLRGRLYFMAERSEGISIGSEIDAKSALLAEVAKYLNVPAGLQIPGFDVRKQGMVYSLNAKYSRATRNVLAYAECVLSRDEVGLSFMKRLFDEGQEAHIPAPDEWFGWEKQNRR